ncbi:MAG: excinuclease ABC subunit UvrA [Bdellovibrionales bacterium]|nr:excinuclease ABC subunit UvrA [Bdellovibrionales bacterium]
MDLIRLRGVRQNNLKNFDIDFPLGQITVITGVSGSGKSSLAFETLYAEGSRRYMESLSTYARQFLEKMPRPDVDTIHNVPPAIALEQRNSITNNRATLATITELYDYLRLLWASAGRQPCKACGHHEVKYNSAETILERVLSLPEATRLYLVVPVPRRSEEPGAKKSPLFDGQILFQQGFQRLLVNNEVVDLSSPEGQTYVSGLLGSEEAFLLVDRFVASRSADRSRLTDSVEQALNLGHGTVWFRSPDGALRVRASEGYSCTQCGEAHMPPHPALFSSNSPLGACAGCSGFGEVLELDEELIVPDRNRTLRDGAVDPLAKPSNADWEKEMLKAMEKRGVSPGTRYKDIKKEDRKFLWEGDGTFPGIRGYFELLKQWKYKLHVRVFIRRYQSLHVCPTCRGSRLAAEPLRFRLGEGEPRSIADVLDSTVEDALRWFSDLKLPVEDAPKTKELLRQIADRLRFLDLVGVQYLKLNRKGNTLSGGEYQRISLASQLGSKLSNTLYVLDEPSIGLHPVDTDKLIRVLHGLRNHGNTVVVVEHDTTVMKSADWLVEIGPEAGAEGGRIVASGTQDKFLQDRASLTARYLKGELSLPPRRERRPGSGKMLRVEGAKGNNLQNVTAEIPLGCLVAVTGVSGSGKSTLVHDTLYKALARVVLQEPIPSHEVGSFKNLQGWEHLGNVLLLDQTPIGRSTRSNAATYMKMYDDIRRIMALQAASARRGLSPSDFSFNVDGGRCPTCKGDGYVEVDMHFMANVRLTCDECNGKRFRQHVLEVDYKGKNIDAILHTTVKEAKILFADVPAIVERCGILEEVGLGYLQLGQPVSTLSGGECQRLKIASTRDQEKQEARRKPTLYIFDEPTTGLHIHDVRKLMEVFHSLVDKGHTVLFIEHNMDLVAQADWIVDIGPGGGLHGGRIVAAGTPEAVANVKTESATARYLAEALPGKPRARGGK